MRVLTFTNLYPNSVQPRHGVFVEQRLRRLVATGQLEACVVAPVPWFPSGHRCFGAWGRFARVPRHEVRHGIDVFHPRYPVIPKVGMSLAPLLMATAVKAFVRQLCKQRNVDLIDAHYFYPDGVAAVRLAAGLRLPVVVSARGSDINVLPRYARPRRSIQRACTECDAIIAVSNDLRRRICELGVPTEKVLALRNGVDLERFRPVDGDDIRASFGLELPLLLSVGNLVPEKGHDLVIESLRTLADTRLLVVGSGPGEKNLKMLADVAGVAERVTFLDYVPQDELPSYYSAADALVLASESEGMPNVVLESIACGTPVIATATGGATEILQVPEAGRLLAERSPAAIADAFRALQDQPPSAAATRRYAAEFGWDDIVRRQLALYEQVITSARAGPG